VSAVDPGGVVARHGLGRIAQTLDELSVCVREMMVAPDQRRELGARARRYVESHHGPEQALEPLAALLDGLIGTDGG
jgi:hypothetical protein